MTIIRASVSLIFSVFLLSSCATAPGTNAGSSGGAAPLVLGPGVYVATSGSDANNGTNASSPMLTIQLAISNAVENGLTNIYVAAGVYKPGAGLNATSNGVMISNNGLNLYGGFSQDFSARNGISELDGTNRHFHILFLKTVTNVIVDGFVLRNGYANDSFLGGGGLYVQLSASVVFTNMIISNNYCQMFGGGVMLDTSSLIALSAVIASNRSDQCGGGVYIYSGYSNTVNCDIVGNVAAAMHGGGIYIENPAWSIAVLGSVISNSSAILGGGIFSTGNDCLFRATVAWNSANTAGGGIYLEIGTGNLLTNSLIANNYAFRGGGMEIFCDQNSLINCVISNNIGSAYGGGISLRGSYNTNLSIIVGNRTTNDTVTCMGGGIYNASGDENLIGGSILQNSTPETLSSGGGIYVNGSRNIITASIIGNYSRQGGGCFFNAGYNLLTNGSVSSNTANNEGGGIMFNSQFNTNYSTVSYNRVTNTSTVPAGGGISMEAGNNYIGGMVLANSTPSTTGYGGGIYCYANNNFFAAVIQNNSAFWGGGIDLNGTGNRLTGSIVSNRAYFDGGGVKIDYLSHNTLIYNAVITNNAGNSMGVIAIESGTNIVISNCIIGGTGAPEFAIYETANPTNQVLIDNTFITNRLGYLYDDYYGTNIPVANWTNINNTNYTGARIASGNIATNI